MANSRQVWAATHVGRVRAENEDRCCVGSWISGGNDTLWEGVLDCRQGSCLAIADGMGGHDAGERASELAIRTIMDLAPSVSSEFDVAQMLEAANNHIYEEIYSRAERRPMGTTVVGIIFRGQQGIIFNIGDSRLYAIRGSELSLESVDDSLTRVLPSRTIRGHALTQSLGGSFRKMPLVPHIKTRNMPRGEGIILCSDGLTDMLTDDELRGIVSRNPTHPAKALIDAALDAGGEDNITAIVIGSI